VLALAIGLLGLTVILGGVLVLVGAKTPGKPPSAWLASLHGIVAAAGVAVLLAALIEGPTRGVATGTQSFGTIAAVLLLLAAGLGIASLVIHIRKRRLPGFWAGAHATIAIAGYVILAVYSLLG
jgi:hypothetical protein